LGAEPGFSSAAGVAYLVEVTHPVVDGGIVFGCVPLGGEEEEVEEKVEEEKVERQ
jgi:hypothetical protein